MKHKSYKFPIYPTEDQKILLNKHFGCARWVYNHFLRERMDQYQQTGKSDGFYAQSAKLPLLKKEEGTEWLAEVSHKSLQSSLRNLDRAYTNFFKKRARFPKFKSRKSKNSFTVVDKCRVSSDTVLFVKFREGIKANIHREVLGKIKSMTISRTPSGKYFVSVLTEQEINHLPKTGKQIGVDLGIKEFAVTSDNRRYENHRYTNKYARKLKKAQQHLSRKKKGSRGSENQRLKVARLHEKISNCRRDTLHKVSMELVRDYDIICIETLNVSGMLKNRKLAKHIADASWYTFTEFLRYKCDWYGKELVKVDRFFASSKTCNSCRSVNKNLQLSDREWVCSSCGSVHDRDFNASVNILIEGLKLSSAGTVEYTGGDSGKTSAGCEARVEEARSSC
jgi:putative transposase